MLRKSKMKRRNTEPSLPGVNEPGGGGGSSGQLSLASVSTSSVSTASTTASNVEGIGSVPGVTPTTIASGRRAKIIEKEERLDKILYE